MSTNGDCVALMKGTLVRPVAKYPASVVTDESLKVAANRVETTLRGNIGSGDTILTLGDPSQIVKDMLLTIDSEIVSVSSVSGNNITVVRGFDGTQPASHASGSVLKANTDAWHHNSLVAEIEAIEQALGPNLANVSGGGGGSSIIAQTYNFTAQTPGGTLVVGANVITLSPVPFGVNATDKHHWLWISQGTGTPEACEIIGGTAVSGAASGTVIVNCASAHSGSWTIASATAGIEEALNVSKYVAVAQNAVIHAPIWMGSNKELYSVPLWGVEITQAQPNTDCVWIGDNSAAKSLGVTVRGLTFSTSSGAWTSGWAINCRWASFIEIRDCYVYGGSLMWGGIQLYKVIRANLWNNYISATVSYGIYIWGQDADQANQSIDCNVIHNEFVGGSSNAIRIGDWTGGLSFRDCIMNGNISAGFYFGSTVTPSGGSNTNYFISECDIEGAGIYAQNIGNLQVVNCWISCTPTVNSLKLASTVDTVLFTSNLLTGGGGAASVPLIDTDATHVVISDNSINGGGVPLIPALISVGPNAKFTSITGNMLMIADKAVQINAAAADTAVTGNTILSTNTPIVGKGITRYVADNKGLDDVQGTSMPAAATIAPLYPRQTVYGTTPIVTITVPDNFSGPLTIFPGNAFTWTTAGNILTAGTAVIGRALIFTFDKDTSKWVPSYV